MRRLEYRLASALLRVVGLLAAFLPVHLDRVVLDTTTPLTEPERTFLHRYYDAVVVGGEWTRRPYAAALRTPLDKVIALGSPRTDPFVDAAAIAEARARVVAAFPVLAGRRVV